MATARAIANGNWSSTSTWSGGVLPGNGDTVYSNSFSIVIDQNITIGAANNPSVAQGSLIAGQWYKITNTGTTNWTSIGASSSSIDTIFLKNATAATGSGGVATALATISTAADANAGAAAGGGFTMTTAYTLAADIRGGTTTCLTISGAGNTTISAGVITQSASGANYGILNNSTGTLTISGGAIITAGSGIVMYNNSSGTISISSATITGGSSVSAIYNNNIGAIAITLSQLIGGNGTANSNAIHNQSSGTITISSSTINSSNTGWSIQNFATGTISISLSNITAVGVFGIVNQSTGTLICVDCTFTASSSASAVSSTNASANNRFSGSQFIHSTNGYPAIYAAKWILNTIPTNSYFQIPVDGVNANSFVRFFTADNSTALNQAAPTDVRSGVAYGIGNSQTGRLTVPARGSVTLSVNYGPSMPFTATRSGTTATATLAYSYPLVVGDTITVTGSSNAEWNGTYTIASVISGTSITFAVPVTYSSTAGTGAQMQTVGTAMLTAADVATAVWGAVARTITGGTVTTLTNAPTVPTAAAIASQVRTELATELARVDVATSSRLATSGYTAPSAAPTVAAIRTEMDSNSTKLANLDATVSSRLASSAYTSPSNSDVAAIKAKTDLLETTRLAQCSTVATTGAQIAAALS